MFKNGNQKIIHFAVFLGSALFIFAGFSSAARAQEESFQIPGIINSQGKHFEITDSNYLNIALESSKDISIRIESVPKMIVFNIKASDEDHSSSFVLSGLLPNETYHKYQDNYHNYQPLTTNGSGIVTFEQDISQAHLIFIQSIKSTKFIKNDAYGGDCESHDNVQGIGHWEVGSNTCFLEKDVIGTIQIESNNVTLDGNKHSLTGNSADTNGVYVLGDNVTVKNINILNFYYGIYFYHSDYSKIDSCILENNSFGIELENSERDTISNNTIRSSEIYGIGLFGSGNNTVTGNISGPGNLYGISEEYKGYNIFENNTASNNKNTGIRLFQGGHSILRGNIASFNPYYGIQIDRAIPFVMKNNAMENNGDSNLDIYNSISPLNDIDFSNTEGGKSIYYLKNIENGTFDGSTDMGSFYCLDCKKVTFKNISLPAGARIFLWRGSDSVVDNIVSVNRSTSVYVLSTRNKITNSDLRDIYVNGTYNKIYGNNFWSVYMPYSSSATNLFNLDTGGNYWKKNEENCIDDDEDGFCNSLYFFSYAGYDRLPRSKPFNFGPPPPPPPPPCCSSVMFLPGHQASRLYRKGFLLEDQLWEPTNHNQDVRQLFLDQNGESIDDGIYTRDIIDKGYGLKNIYQGFSDSMNQFVSTGAIKEWKPIPYDWRLPLEKIVGDDGVKLENGGHMDIVAELKRMAAASKTGKVTLIGHSNGGLLAKVLVDKLKEAGKENLVDKMILVATPQLGTPQAIASLLHGDNTDLLLGLTIDKKTGRSFGENMVSVYNLLPSKEYFDVVQSPVVEFDGNVKNIYDFQSLYSDNINSWEEFKKFLLGDNGARSEPSEGDLNSPNVLRENLLSQSEATHQNLDDWQAPDGLKIFQIAGWGLDTTRGIKYSDCDFLFCPHKLSNLDRSLLFAQDGDGTVEVPSAVEMGGNAERYYLNIFSYNQNNNVEHADILEIKPLQDFIKNIIQNKNVLTGYISTEKPEVKAEDKRLRYRLHSPVKLDVFDENGNHTGLIKSGESDPDLWMAEEKIPNSYYTEFGDTKYAGSGVYSEKIILTGEDLGTFTFDVDQISGDKVDKTTTFANIPVMKDMKAELSVSSSSDIGEMKVDIDNDGETDAIFRPGEEIKKEDKLGILEKIINSLDVNETVKNRLINKIENARKQMEKKHDTSSNAMLENVIQQIVVFSDENGPEKFLIPKDKAERLMEIINTMLD